jgi:hypothetical protein
MSLLKRKKAGSEEKQYYRYFFPLLLILLVPIAHEMGHYVIYALCHPDYPVWIELSWMGLQTKYHCVFSWARPWVFAGGLIFTIPFVGVCVLSKDWLTWSIWVGFMLYGLIETVWGLMI